VNELDEQLKAEIDSLSRINMARLWRFAPAGHKYFVRGPVFDYFKARFDKLGGFSPSISKKIGWEDKS